MGHLSSAVQAQALTIQLLRIGPSGRSMTPERSAMKAERSAMSALLSQSVFVPVRLRSTTADVLPAECVQVSPAWKIVQAHKSTYTGPPARPLSSCRALSPLPCGSQPASTWIAGTHATSPCVKTLANR